MRRRIYFPHLHGYGTVELASRLRKELGQQIQRLLTECLANLGRPPTEERNLQIDKGVLGSAIADKEVIVNHPATLQACGIDMTRRGKKRVKALRKLWEID